MSSGYTGIIRFYSASGYTNKTYLYGFNSGSNYFLDFYVAGLKCVSMRSDSTQVYGFGNIFAWSDDRCKFNEELITDGLSVIRQLEPQSYDRSESFTEENTVKECGFIAQEVLAIPQLAHAVKGDPNDNERIGLQYNSVFTYAVAAIKELDTIIQSQQNEINDLKANYNTRLSLLEAQLLKTSTL